MCASGKESIAEKGSARSCARAGVANPLCCLRMGVDVCSTECDGLRAPFALKSSSAIWSAHRVASARTAPRPSVGDVIVDQSAGMDEGPLGLTVDTIWEGVEGGGIRMAGNTMPGSLAPASARWSELDRCAVGLQGLVGMNNPGCGNRPIGEVLEGG